jgi:hypothetical protein
MAHRFFDLASVFLLAYWLLKVVRSFFFSDIVCVVAECVAAEWRRLTTAHHSPPGGEEAPAVASANATPVSRLEFSGD